MPFLLADTPLTQLDNTGKPERKQWLAMISLSLVSFVVSLDATILVAALPVSYHAAGALFDRGR
jgi:hypothetical protein